MKPKQHILSWACCIILLSSVNVAYSQQLPQYSLYSLNNYILNPAVTGIEDYIDAKVSYRNQWTSIEGAPTTYYVSAHGSIGKQYSNPNGGMQLRAKGSFGPKKYISSYSKYQKSRPHQGLGGIIFRDNYGPLTISSATVSYALHIPLKKSGYYISIGASGGVSQFSFNTSMLTTEQPNDVAIGTGSINKLIPNLNAGFWLYNRKFYFGGSMYQALPNKLSIGYTEAAATGSTVSHYFSTLGFRTYITEKWSLIPSIMVKGTGSNPITVDGTVRANFANKVWFGAGYRSGDAAIGQVGANLSSYLNIAYSYDYTVSGLRPTTKSTHEVLLGFMLNNRKRTLCPEMLW